MSDEDAVARQRLDAHIREVAQAKGIDRAHRREIEREMRRDLKHRSPPTPYSANREARRRALRGMVRRPCARCPHEEAVHKDLPAMCCAPGCKCKGYEARPEHPTDHCGGCRHQRQRHGPNGCAAVSCGCRAFV